MNNNNLPDEKVKEILDESNRRLNLPPEKKLPQFVLAPVGLVGAGKTTVVRPLAERLGMVRISTDEIRKILKEQGYNYTLVREIATELARKYARAGYRIAVDADNGSRRAKEIIESFAREEGVPVIWIHINPPEEFILSKLRSYPHKQGWLFKNADEAVKNYFDQKAAREPLDFPFIYHFDPSRPDLPRQLDEAARAILLSA